MPGESHKVLEYHLRLFLRNCWRIDPSLEEVGQFGIGWVANLHLKPLLLARNFLKRPKFLKEEEGKLPLKPLVERLITCKELKLSNTSESWPEKLLLLTSRVWREESVERSFGRGPYKWLLETLRIWRDGMLANPWDNLPLRPLLEREMPTICVETASQLTPSQSQQLPLLLLEPQPFLRDVMFTAFMNRRRASASPLVQESEVRSSPSEYRRNRRQYRVLVMVMGLTMLKAESCKEVLWTSLHLSFFFSVTLYIYLYIFF